MISLGLHPSSILTRLLAITAQLACEKFDYSWVTFFSSFFFDEMILVGKDWSEIVCVARLVRDSNQDLVLGNGKRK
jgi:hypothetical protein